MAPFQEKPRQLDVQEAVARAVKHHRAVTTARAKAAQAESLRAGAINDALARGATLRELAKQLQVSPETIRQWALAERA